MDNNYEQQLQKLMQKAIELVKANTFVAGYNATDEEALGIILSKTTEWSGLAILETAHYALEDANFHKEASKLEDMATELREEFKSV